MHSPATSIVVGFSHPVDATLVSAPTNPLRAWPADDAALIDEVAIPASSPALGNPTAVLILPMQALSMGSYEQTVRGGADGSLGLADRDARSLGPDQAFVFSMDPQET
jgi:hypothetical protein